MNKIKDFFYDKNDVIVALIILAVAVFIIYVRIGDIMKYPETLVATNQTTTSAVSENATLTETMAPGTAATDESTVTAAADTKSITISDDAISTTVSKQLQDAGLIASSTDFEAALKKYHMAGSIRSGTFQIPTDATNEEIIEIITKQKLNLDYDSNSSIIFSRRALCCPFIVAASAFTVCSCFS